jgi:hypothetical protein
LLLAGTILASMHFPASAATLHVEADGTGEYATIADAVAAAEPGDVVELGDGTFTGPGNLGVWIGGITIRSASGDPTRTRIDGEGEAPEGLNVVGASTAIEGLTLTGCFGGALNVVQEAATVENCIFAGNVFHVAGNPAILVGQAEASFVGCLIAGNANGGIEVLDGIVDLTACTIAGNVRDDRGAGIAVGGLVGSTMTLDRCVVWGNCAPEGGFWSGETADVTISCSVIDRSGILGTVDFVGENPDQDPGFCDPESCEAVPTIGGDYALEAGSIALPDGSPCGEQIGARGEGCPATPVRSTTWTELKGLHQTGDHAR